MLCTISLLGTIQVNCSYLSSCLLFYRNYKPLGMDYQGGFYTAHFWSLAVEEHFYLIWPILLIAAKPKRAGKVVFVFAMVVFAWRNAESHFQWLAGILLPANLLSRSDTKMDAFCGDASRQSTFPRSSAIVRAFVSRSYGFRFWQHCWSSKSSTPPGLILLRAVLLPPLVLSTVIQPDSFLGRILEWQPLRWIGTISYSLYLWQQLFLPELASERAQGAFHYLQQPPWNVLAILICACLSRYLIEIPMTRLGHGQRIATGLAQGGRVISRTFLIGCADSWKMTADVLRSSRLLFGLNYL